MKFASSATLLLAAALSTLSAAQDVIAQASVKPMVVKPGGLVAVSLEMVFSEEFRRKLSSEYESDFLVGCFPTDLSASEIESFTFNKNGTKNSNNGDKHNKTDNAKPDKAAGPGGKLDLFYEPSDVTLNSASIKPNTWRPRVVADTSDFEDTGFVLFELPEDGISRLKRYTATFKFRLGDSWDSGDIPTFAVGTPSTGYFWVNAIVR